MAFEDHPGFLGLTSEGKLLIHAAWPAYAIDHGWKYALETLGQFPAGTRFEEIDDIDECFLLLVEVGHRERDVSKFDERNFHVAVWHADLLELFAKGYVSGVSLTPGEWAKRRVEELWALLRQCASETKVDSLIPAPSADDFTDLEAIRGLISNDGLVVTKSGFIALDSVLAEDRNTIAPEILSRTRGVMLTRHYDTAVREACVLVEDTMRKTLGSSNHGMKLVDEFLARADKTKKFISAQLKVFRTQVKTTFKFVRNEYMHNLKDISQAQCYALLVRVSFVYKGVRLIEEVLRSERG